jgi:cell division protease FtsH
MRMTLKQSAKTLLVWVVFISLTLFALWNYRAKPGATEIEFSQFVNRALPAAAEPGATPPLSDVKSVTVKGDRLEGEFLDGSRFTTVGDLKDFQKDLIARGISVRYESQDAGIWVTILTTWLPMLLFVFLFLMFMRQAQSGGGKLFSFGKSKHRMLSEDSRKVTFADIAGIEEAKQELHEIIEFLKDPKKFTRLGGRIPKGVLLMGPPGTGKTLLARGVAGEAGVPFLSISGSDFVEMFVGVGASRVRDLFEQGKKRSPCIIFIDEIDAVGRQRGAGLGGGHDEREQTLNQLLVEMDGFESNSGVIIVAATNRPDVLDPALMRPGRFDRRIVVPSPDVRGREAILKVHTKNVPLEDDVDLALVARGTPGFVGADLENIVNEAALLAARKDQEKVRMADLEESKDKVLMGTARKSIVMNDHERELTAFHEAGHAIVARSVPGSDPLHKVTIIPRGMALGLTQQLPSEDRYTASKSYLLGRLAILMGGRAAEMLAFGEVSSGAGQDIKMATEQARRMVAQFGMSILGPIHMDQASEMVFLGKDLSSHTVVSEATAQRVDREVKRMILEAQDEATRILTERRDALDGLAKALLARETLDGPEVEAVLEGNPAAVPPEGGPA